MYDITILSGRTQRVLQSGISICKTSKCEHIKSSGIVWT